MNETAMQFTIRTLYPINGGEVTEWIGIQFMLTGRLFIIGSQLVLNVGLRDQRENTGPTYLMPMLKFWTNYNTQFKYLNVT